MKVSDFNFELPDHLIAQTPLQKRDHSKLMVINRDDKTIAHHHFYELVKFLKPGDVLVRNNSRVMPARLFGIKKSTNAQVELLILKQVDDVYECLVGNARVVKIDTQVSFDNDRLIATCVGIKDEGIRLFKMTHEGPFLEVLKRLGTMPLPPYIKERLLDQERYQTVYSKTIGSAAAPTAGLHFTKEIVNQLEAKGVQIVDLTLHVGLGTFKPVKVDSIDQHQMHREHYLVSTAAATTLNRAKANKQRIISVGTTSTRVLETQMQRYGKFVAEESETDIFIYPGYQFLAIDGLITNFHLPKSTLIMLVSAFCSKSLTMKAYHEAIIHHYRFFSFGDSMLIL